MEYSCAMNRVEAYLESLTSPLRARRVIPLNEGWRFLSRDADASAPGYDDGAWRVLDVPHDWSVEGGFSNANPSTGSGGWVQTGVVWYRKRFTLMDSPTCGKHFILFDGVSMNAGIWINGHFLGTHPYGFTPFWFDVTPWVRPAGEENVLAVRVDTSLQPFSRFYHGTGIIRPVTLISTGPLHIDVWGVKADTVALSDESADVAIATQVRAGAYPETQWHGFGQEPQQESSRACTLVTSILDGDIEVAQATTTAVIVNFNGRAFAQTLRVPAPKPWSVESPHLYRIRSRLVVDGETVDDTVTPLGIRTLAWSADTGFVVNRTPVKFKGVCLHQDSGAWGAAVPAKAWVRKLLTLKAMGCNAVRTAHHPFPSVFYDCCDALGMMVMDESFDEWRKGWEREYAEQPWGKNTYGYSMWFDQWHDTDMRAMLRRDRCHPSVVMWSVGNEIPDLYYEEGVETLRKLIRICKEEDASRPVTVGAEGQYRLPIHEGILGQLDVAGLNYVNIRHPQAYYEDLHMAHPGWLMLGTETFYDPGHIPAVKNRPYAAGQFLWVGYDYLGEAFDPTETIDVARATKRLQHGWAGMVDVLDTPRAEYWYRQSLWAEKPVAHMAVKTGEWVREWWNQIKGAYHWNWTDGETKTVYCFTNCEEIELKLNGMSLGKRCKNADDPMPVEWEVEYRPGVIELIGYTAGSPVCSHRMETAGPACSLALRCDSICLAAGGTDFAHATVEIVDERGRVVPGATHRVSFAVSGAGSLLGAINGDMNDAEGCRNASCLAVDGRCMALLMSGKQPGTLTLTATAEGLEPASISVDIR